MSVISVILILLSAIFVTGIINRTKACFSGRKGLSVFQHLLNARLLLRKGSVFSETGGYVTQTAPVVYLGAILSAMLFVPFVHFPAALSFDGDFVMFAYLLALSRMAIILLALDAGSSFQGMGSAREALYGMLVEPAVFILLGTLALISGCDSFTEIFDHLDNASTNMIILSALVGYAFMNIGITEGCRMPVDDPKTHLELTMIHEVMILDVSGFDLALMQIGGWIKMSLFAVLFANVMIPANWSLGWSLAGFVVSQIVFAGVIGAIESLRARNKMTKNSIYIISIVAVALMTFIVAFLLTQSPEIGL